MTIFISMIFKYTLENFLNSMLCRTEMTDFELVVSQLFLPVRGVVTP